MKLTIFFLIVVCLHVSAAGYGQKGTVTISGKDLSLEKVFSVIKKQTDFVCFYGYDVLKDARPVSLSFKDADVQEVLKAALWGQGLDFSITGKTITIMKKPISAAVGSGPFRTIKAMGVVYNEAGQPLSGANVTIKATGKGTITNAKGEFMLPAVPEESPLVISFIGYAPQLIKVSEGIPVQVYLNVAKNELDKVVVQAYGTTTQRLATGNIATVTKEQIERQPVMNVLSALQGQVPGVVVSQKNGYASANFSVEIRGRSVLSNLPADPLYIIDGVPLTVLTLNKYDGYGGSSGFLQNGFTGPANGQSPLFSVDPADIESLTVLKDADATAIYGSRGANGVIIINTKKGKIGKTKFDMNVYSGASFVTGRYNLMDTKEYVAMRLEALKNDGLTPDPGADYDITTWDTTRYTDWQKQLWGGTGHTYDIQGSFSGGDKQTSFRIGGGYHRETSMFTASGADQRASLQFNITHHSLDQRLELSLTSAYSYVNSSMINIYASVLTPPDAPAVLDKRGFLNFDGWQPVPDMLGNFGAIFQPYSVKTNFLNSQFSMQYKIMKGLTFSTQLGYSTFNVPQKYITPIISQNPNYSPTGSNQFGNNNGYNAIIEPQVDYKLSLGRLNINALVGGSIQTVSQDGNTIFGSGYVNDNLLNSIASAKVKNASDVSGQYKYNAVFGRLNFNYDDIYILNMSARRDGSSRFGPGKQFGDFGAVGLAWIPSQYNWWKDNLSFISFAKLRSSYGITGSDQIGDYKYLSLWGAATLLPYQNMPTYIPQGFANPDLRWQANRKLEVAVNLGFLKDRIMAEVVWYQNRCGNQLITYPLPALTGFNNVAQNWNAVIQNRGVEATITAKIIDKKDWQWTSTFNIGMNRNRLVSFPNLALSSFAGQYFIGKSLSISQYLHYTGVDPQTGQYTYLDKNHDGVLNTNTNDTATDLITKDFAVPFDGGFTSTVTFKAFQLSAFFTFRKQLLAIGEYSQIPGTNGAQSNQPRDVLNRWQKPGDHAKFARYTTMPQESDNYFSLSDATITDGSYIRLRNLSLSYDLPDKILKRAGLINIRIYARGENLFVISKYKGLDPEASSPGILPPSKIFTGGVQFTF